jgi:hypothetical protein
LGEVLDACKAEGFPFGLPIAIHLVWSLVHRFAKVWRSGSSVGPITRDSIRIDFEGAILLQDLEWIPTVAAVAVSSDGTPELRSLFPPLGPDGSLAEEAHRLGRLLYELFTLRPFPLDLGSDPLSSRANLWAPDGQEALPERLRTGLARLLGEEEAFGTVESGLAELASVLGDDEAEPTTFNLALLIHTLFRRELDQERTLMAEEREQLSQESVWTRRPQPSPLRPAEASQPFAPRFRVWVVAGAAALLAAGGGTLAFLRGQERTRVALQEELVRLQTDHALRMQQGVDAESLAHLQERYRTEIEDLAKRAANSAAAEKIHKELAGLSPKGQAASARNPPAPAPAVLRAMESSPPPALIPLRPPPQPDRPPSAVPAASPAALAVPKSPPSPSLEEGVPRVVTTVRPQWPAGKSTGMVEVRVFVHETGRVLKVSPVPGSGVSPEAVAAAVDAALRSTFKPALRDGKAVREWTVMRFLPGQ